MVHNSYGYQMKMIVYTLIDRTLQFKIRFLKKKIRPRINFAK